MLIQDQSRTVESELLALPVISIVVPSLNYGRYLERCIESVLRQGYPRLELIVLDGGSTDSSIEIIRRYESEITLWRSKKDDGQAAAINEGIALTTGSIVNWLNADDELTNDSLFVIASAFLANPKADIFTGGRNFINDSGEYCGSRMDWCTKLIDYSVGIPDFPQESTFFTKRLFDQVGGLDASLSFSLDVDFFKRALDARASVVCLEAVIGSLRLHENMKTLSANPKRTREAALVKRRVCHRKKAYLCLCRLRIERLALRMSIIKPVSKIFLFRYSSLAMRWTTSNFSF